MWLGVGEKKKRGKMAVLGGGVEIHVNMVP